MGKDIEKQIQELRGDKLKAKQKGTNWRSVAEICNYLGKLLTATGKYEDALNEHREEQKICMKNGDMLATAVAHRGIGETLSEMGDHIQALKHQKMYLELATDVKNAVEVQRAWATIGRTYLLHYQDKSDEDAGHLLDSAQKAFQRALTLSEGIKQLIKERDYSEAKCRLFLNLGLVYEMRGMFEECKDYFQKAIYLSSKWDLKEDLNRCQYSLAGFCQRQGRLREASRIFDDALSTAKSMKNTINICDALMGKGMVLVMLKDFVGARRYFKKAYYTGSPITEEVQKTKRTLKIVTRMCELQRKLTRTEDTHERIELFDKLGDYCISLKCLEIAIDFYKEELDLALKVTKSNAELAVIYISIAQTYLDIGQFANAAVYFYKELDCRKGNSDDECETLLKIADIKEMLKEEPHIISDIYEEALGKSSNNAKLRYLTLRSYDAYLSQIDALADKRAVIHDMFQGATYPEDDNEEEASEPGDSQESKADDELYASDVSAPTSASEPETVQDNTTQKSRPKRLTKRSEMKVNDVGETPLHKACIEGNLKSVKMWVEEKMHPINPRDYCGWLPIHEAVNHGHLDVIKYLIEHGAYINDQGGDMCDGISPLHDAASCGHMNIVRYLIKKGANVTAVTKNGENVLNCLRAWRKRCGQLDEADTKDFELLEKELETELTKVGITKSTVGRFTSKRQRSPCNSPEKCSDELSSPLNRSPISSPVHYSGTVSSIDYDDPNTARREYSSAIASLRRQNDSLKDNRKSHKPKSKNVSALVNAVGLVRDDDWLIDDIGVKQKKRPCIDLYENATTNSTNRTRQPRTEGSGRNRNNAGRQFGYISDDDVIEMEVHEDDYEIPQPDESYSPEPSQATSHTSSVVMPSSLKAPVLCARVQIEEKTLAIPIHDRTKAMQWLISEVEKRYFAMTGKKPVITLYTTDDALLSSDDAIADIITEQNTKVIAKVESWNLASLPLRYEEMCKLECTEPSAELISDLQITEISGVLQLSNTSISPEHIKPLARAIQCQTNLREIDISSSKVVFHDSCNLLISSLPSLHNLQVLNMCCACVTESTLSVLKKQDLNSLVELDLSYNPLDDDCSVHLIDIIAKFQSLKVLNLTGCDFTDQTFGKGNILQAIQGSQLRQISLEFNEVSNSILKEYRQEKT